MNINGHVLIRTENTGSADMQSLFVRNYSNDDGSELPVLYSPLLEKDGNEDLFMHMFTTRAGGVSTGPYASMNLGFKRGDRDEDVRENFRRISAAAGIGCDRFVLSQQTHTDNVRTVTSADAGKGVTRERDYTDVDALVTNEKGLVLVVYIADCVPILLADPVHKAAGAVHSGWRGTAKQIVLKTLEVMNSNYGTVPEDVYAAIGPCICQDCYEIGPEVAAEFGFDGRILKKGKGDRYHLDLRKANLELLIAAGLKKENIAAGDVCTCCNRDILFSHRGNGPVRGNLAGLIALKN